MPDIETTIRGERIELLATFVSAVCFLVAGALQYAGSIVLKRLRQ